MDPSLAFPAHLPPVGTGLGYFVLATLAAALVLGVLLARERPRHDPGRHSPRLAWLRAGLYFCGVLLVAWLAGVLEAIVRAPVVRPGQAADPAWLALTGLCWALLGWGYLYWWPRGTLTHGRRAWPLASALFGLGWGACAGLVLLVFYAIYARFQWSVLGTAAATFVTAAIYSLNYQAGWWDIHVSPPHNLRAWNARKVLFAHQPFMLATLAHLALFGNAALFVGWYALAMSASAVAMRFPPFWEADGPPVSLETALGE